MGYRHTQVGGVMLALFVLVGAMLVGLMLPMWSRGRTFSVLLTTIIFILFVSTFSTLTVEVGDGKLAFRFGIGLYGRSYPLADIQSVREVHNPWYYMWGVKLVPGGWLYAVGPGSAVEIIFINGKQIRLGTDDPAGLRTAIEAWIR